MGRIKPNRTGRIDRAEHWTKMLRPIMEEPAWRSLSTTAQALYPWLKLEWKGPDANNNGAIRLSVRQAAQRLGVGVDTAARAFHDLQAKGFIVMREHAHLGLSGMAKSPAFELTGIEMPHASQRSGTRIYREWHEGHDFPVHKAAVHNPRGRFRKAEPCLQEPDGPVGETLAFPREAVCQMRTARLGNHGDGARSDGAAVTLPQTPLAYQGPWPSLILPKTSRGPWATSTWTDDGEVLSERHGAP